MRAPPCVGTRRFLHELKTSRRDPSDDAGHHRADAFGQFEAGERDLGKQVGQQEQVAAHAGADLQHRLGPDGLDAADDGLPEERMGPPSRRMKPWPFQSK